MLISVKGLTKSWSGCLALDDMTLEMEEGVFGLIGPNGAGKTTLLRILLGLIRPDGGRAYIFGHDVVSSSTTVKQRIGVLHEKPRYPDNISVVDYLSIVSRIYESDRTPLDTLELVKLDYAAKMKIKHLSAGMYQRLGLAQSLIGQPELVFLDEPTSNLDVEGRRDIISLIRHLRDELEVSFFITSHILTELEKVCDKVAFMNDGCLAESGGVLELIKKYTKRRYRVITPQPQRVYDKLKDRNWWAHGEMFGANAITVVITDDSYESFMSDIESLKKSDQMKIYDVEKAESLEDVYSEVVN